MCILVCISTFFLDLIYKASVFLLSLWAHRQVNFHILNTVWCTVTWKGWWVKGLLTSKKVFQSQSRAGVFTLWAGTDSVLGVSSRFVALQRRLFHSHRGVFVLLREAIQQPHRARILLQPRAEWRVRCVPRHNQTLLPSCVPSPAWPARSFLSLSLPQDWWRQPHGHLVFPHSPSVGQLTTHSHPSTLMYHWISLKRCFILSNPFLFFYKHKKAYSKC